MRAAASAMFGARLGRPISDERLVARVRAGDAQAFEEIYDRYSRPIHSFCRHLLGQPDDSEDAVQHTFLAAYRGIHRSDQPIDLKPWLFAIARNRCVSVLRARRRDPALASAGSTPEPVTEGLLAAVERRESLRDLLRDIGTLPEDQRSALILTQLGTLKHEEVARVLGVPTAKVRALVFQARNSLISTRLARETACHDIREQLATLTGGGLRRGNLRRHLVSCSGCRDYQLALKRQRAAIVALLPVVAQPLLRQKILAEVAGGAGAGAGAAAGVGGVAGWLAANGVALKVGLAATLAATGVGAAVVTGGLHRAVGHSHPTPVVELAQARASTGSPAKPLAAAPRRQAARPRYQVIDLHKPKRSSSNKPKHRSPHLKVPSATRTEQTDRETTTAPSNTPASSPTSPGQAKQPGDSPRGQTRNDGTPPGLAKQGGTPPGLSKQGGTPPGQVKQNTLPPAATTPAPATPPGNANGQDNGNAGGNRNGPAGSNAGGNGDGHGSGNAGGNGNGH